MCKQLCLKYAPEIRFFRYKVQESVNEIDTDLKSVMPDIIKSELKEKAAEQNLPPIVKKSDFKKMCEESYDNVVRVMMQQPDYASIIFENKTKKKFDENGKKIRNNRDENGVKKKYKKKDKASVFWNK